MALVAEIEKWRIKPILEAEATDFTVGQKGEVIIWSFKSEPLRRCLYH